MKEVRLACLKFADAYHVKNDRPAVKPGDGAHRFRYAPARTTPQLRLGVSLGVRSHEVPVHSKVEERLDL